MNLALEPALAADGEKSARHNVIRAACDRIPPLWPLKNFVAVNPFLGLAGRDFLDAARLVKHVGHADLLMPAAYYREQIRNGRIQADDLAAALKLAEPSLATEWGQPFQGMDLPGLEEGLARNFAEAATEQVLTFAEFLDAANRTNWVAFVMEEISKWCSAYFDQGQSAWRMPWRESGLLAAWKQAAALDANPELMGIRNFRKFAAALPDDPVEIIDRALVRLEIPEPAQTNFLHRQLMSLPGWSGYLQYRVREKRLAGTNDTTLVEFLAIRLIYDLALLQAFGGAPEIFANWKQHVAASGEFESRMPAGLLIRHVAQLALECGYQRELIRRLQTKPVVPAAPNPKTLAAVFCIDVRSEVFRRALEAQSDEIETIGFAGFFGMPIEYHRFGQPEGNAQCPVLLTPKFKVRETMRHGDAGGEARWQRRRHFRQTVSGAWNAFKTSAISCFSFVETAGLWFGVKLAKDSLGLTTADLGYATANRQRRFAPRIEREACCRDAQDAGAGTGLSLADQIGLAAGALKNMGLVSHFARVVLLCGHGSATANNPYGSALDCGACGGHAGDANARVAAAILNEPAVRAGLKEQGIEIPAATVFIAALHNTTTDEILVYDDVALAPEQAAELEKIQGWLRAASRQARRERAPSLGLGESAEADLHRQFRARSRDWSQVRPEWGLAGNAAFIAAPRERTRGIHLGGRVFLHNYQPQLDADKSTLELILVAPMIVASWINLQYYGSTVDNRVFGSGNKVLHNVVGTFGVWQGNGGDLQSGLPLQSLQDGRRWLHEPLRLSVFIEAPCAEIERVIARHPEVRQLIENHWIHLFALEPGGGRIWRHTGGTFQPETRPVDRN
jgi:uncharacterized protein YbcC (UPF0753/DUF2309 family)